MSSIEKTTTDEGLRDFSEVLPLGSAYMHAFARGIPSGIKEICSLLIGQDPLRIKYIDNLMGSTLRGHNIVKDLIDVACWDIMNQAIAVSICTLIEGQHVEKYPIHRAISQHSPEEMANDVSRTSDQKDIVVSDSKWVAPPMRKEGHLKVPS